MYLALFYECLNALVVHWWAFVVILWVVGLIFLRPPKTEIFHRRKGWSWVVAGAFFNYVFAPLITPLVVCFVVIARVTLGKKIDYSSKRSSKNV